MKTRSMFILAALACAGSIASLAQRQLGAVQPCRVRVVIMDSNNRPVRDANVELQDEGSFSNGRQKTEDDGRVEFSTMTGGHRLRVFGSEFDTVETDFIVSNSESLHVEYVRVRMHAPSGNGAPGTAVPAVRLKIPPDAQKEFDKGTKASASNDWKTASAAFEQATKLYPDYDLAYNGLGIALSSQGNRDEAKKAFEKAIAITPTFALAQRNLGRILIGESDWAGADQALRKSLQTEPENVWALNNAAYAELQLHDFENAVANAKAVHALPHAGFETSHIVAAVACEQLGKTAEARAEYQMYLKEAPKGNNANRAREGIARLSK